ncbi:MAG: thiamine pyrophosphate-binding protein [Alphaproteobacteria bacterium]|tara:strand:- start:1023 stop:2681 length:1659 start_codon:yes stop_codon:yes gene_type:complete
MKKITGRSAFLSILKSEGVTHLFGNPGTTELPIMHALKEYPEIKYILGLQEAIVVAMADGYSRATGKLSACNVHVAPGLGNAMGAIYNAKFVGSPIIITAGQQEQGHGLMEPMLYGPLVRMAEPLVKWATEVTRLEDLPRIMRRAAKIALSPPTGPVFISLPGDILNTEAKIDLGSPTRIIDSYRPSHNSIELIAKKITKFNKPIIVVGHEVASYNAFKEVAMFAELSGSAVYQQTVPHGSHFPSEHIAFMGALPRLQNPTKKILENYDLLICVGCDGLRMSVWNDTEPLPSKMPIIHIGINEWEIGKNYFTELAIIGNVKNTLHDINQYLKNTLTSKESVKAKKNLEHIAKNNWTVKKKKLISKTLDDKLKKPITPNWLMMNIANNITKNNIVVEEGLVSTRALLNYLPYKNNKDFYGLASGGIGWAVSGAIGIALANPSKTIIAIIGDGSSMYGIQSLWSAAHYKLPIVYIIANNQSYRIIKERLEAFHKNTNFVGMDFNKPKIDFSKLANSLGIQSETINNPKNLDSIFKKAFKYKKPYLLNVMVDKGY